MKYTIKKDQKIGEIFEKVQNSRSKARVLASVRKNISSGTKFYIFTPNPEIFLLCLKDKDYLSLLKSAPILILDGVGLAIAQDFLNLPSTKSKVLNAFLYIFQGFSSGARFMFKRKGMVIKGRELFLDLVKFGNTQGWKVFLLGGVNNEAGDVKEALELTFKKIKIQAERGPLLNEKGLPVSKIDRSIEKEIINKINSFAPEIVFVSFGAPKQEYWIKNNLGKIKAGGAMAVGGAFKYVSGEAKLPPQAMQKLGLEWLWRFFQEPRRIKRIFNAVVLFPLKIYLYKLNR